MVILLRLSQATLKPGAGNILTSRPRLVEFLMCLVQIILCLLFLFAQGERKNTQNAPVMMLLTAQNTPFLLKSFFILK